MKRTGAKGKARRKPPTIPMGRTPFSEVSDRVLELIGEAWPIPPALLHRYGPQFLQLIALQDQDGEGGASKGPDLSKPGTEGAYHTPDRIYVWDDAAQPPTWGPMILYRPRVLGQWFDGIRFYAAASSPTRSRRTCAGLR